MVTPMGRLLWLCRRGHRELDILLNRFLRGHHSTLSTEERRDFERLLHQADVDILAWLTNRRPPPPDLAGIVQRVLDRTAS